MEVVSEGGESRWRVEVVSEGGNSKLYAVFIQLTCTPDTSSFLSQRLV